MKMGVVADDITGANDIGIMFAKSGYLTHVYTVGEEGRDVTCTEALGSTKWPEPHIAILNTSSRLDTRDIAYRKVYAATAALQEAGCKQFHNKTCSVFRGNIGAEFDAMLDALGQEFAIVVLGFPKNGRTTVNGIHYVRGQRLEDSEFRNDPIHPMRESYLVSILQQQTPRRVAMLDHAVVAEGAAALRARIGEMKARANYLILDVVDQEALGTIARAVHDLPVLCGSSAIAEELPAVWPRPDQREETTLLPPRTGAGVLCAAGSLMPQTRHQLIHLASQGLPTFSLAPEELFDEQAREVMIMRLALQIGARLASGEDVVLHTPNSEAAVAETRRQGAAVSLTPTATGRVVSLTIAEIVSQVVRTCDLNRLVIAGGETSAAVCARLNVDRLHIWREIQPGLPSCISLQAKPLLLVLKSGSFGSEDFLEQAIAHVKAQ